MKKFCDTFIQSLGLGWLWSHHTHGPSAMVRGKQARGQRLLPVHPAEPLAELSIRGHSALQPLGITCAPVEGKGMPWSTSHKISKSIPDSPTSNSAGTKYRWPLTQAAKCRSTSAKVCRSLGAPTRQPQLGAAMLPGPKGPARPDSKIPVPADGQQPKGG